MNGKRKNVTANAVRSLAIASPNPVFKTIRFHDALKDFRKYKCRTPNVISFDLDRELRWIENHISENTTTVEEELLML